MGLKDTWKDKVDGVDDVLAEDINSIAGAVIKLEENEEIVTNTAPYIGPNGNWYIYDVTLKKYIDSQKSSKGEKGDKGDTGNNGKTPVYGSDYFTPEQQEEFAEAIKTDVTAEVSKETKNLQYYGNAEIFPSDNRFFVFTTDDETMTAAISATDPTTISGNIVIPYEYEINRKIYKVTTIDSSAFENSSKITDVVIPSSVTEIGLSAFNNCSFLKNIFIPDSVKTIKESAFWGCASLETIVLPDNVVLNADAFAFSTNLKKIDISRSNITVIPRDIFAGCTSLRSITIPDGVTKIGMNAFWDNTLDSIVFPSSLTEIDDSAFSCEIKDIYFRGTEEQWNNIVAEGFKTLLKDAQEQAGIDIKIHYDYVPATEGYVNEKFDELSPAITETGDVDTYEMELLNNHVTSMGIVSKSLTVTIGEAQSLNHTSVIYFTTPDTIPENYTTFPETINFKGDGTSAGAFTPEEDTRYTIIFDYNGNNVTAYVSGVKAI